MRRHNKFLFLEHSRTKTGFTLIELSIVLVIIGLIIGGVLVGRDLIHAAEIRKTITQIEQTKTAVETFRGKYNCIPGDCANASEFFTGAENGNGDGMIGYGNDAGTIYENFNVWHHLMLAGLVAGKFVTSTQAQAIGDPTIQNWCASTALGTNLCYDHVSNLNSGGLAANLETPGPIIGNALMLTSAWVDQYPYDIPLQVGDLIDIVNAYELTNPLFGTTAADSFAIDSKMDDGKAYSGKVVIGIETSANSCANDTAGAGLGDYESNDTTVQCALFFY